MKWLLLLLSFFIKPLSTMGEQPHIIEELKQSLSLNAFKLFISLFFIATTSLIFTIGLVFTTMLLASQYDQVKNFSLTGGIIGGLALMAISLFGLILLKVTLRTESAAKLKIKEKQIQKNQAEFHPLENAIALLVNDFVKERELKRARDQESYPEHTPSSPNQTHSTH